MGLIFINRINTSSGPDLCPLVKTESTWEQRTSSQRKTETGAPDETRARDWMHGVYFLRSQLVPA
ncbi:MAG: hypothetical protein Ct9H300mP1_39580 [Planctomycetaceae bacterium]|nr:MAG: hypothetical protein Ct9H300mP1_39580 [Planctomycetaceae bacterium]